MHIENDEIYSIEYLGELDCWDLSMKDQDYANFIANNGFIVHNSRPGPLHCLAYNSIIYDCDKDRYVKIETAFGDGISSTHSMFKDGWVGKHKIKEIIDTGKQSVYELRLSGSIACKATLNHRFVTKDGWKKLGEISMLDEILVSDFQYHPIISIIFAGSEQTYDIEMESSEDFYLGEPNFIADSIVVHNSGQAQSITQAKSEGTYKTWNTGVVSVDDILNEITSYTYGFMVFQEQIMRAMKEVGDFTWQEVAAIRNAMSKSLGDEFFNKYRQVFIDGSNKLHDLPEEEANNIYDHVIHFGNWAFNRSFSGNTLILNTNPNQFAPKWITIKELYENKGYATPRWKEQPEAYKKMNTLSLCDDGKLRPGRIKDVFYHGEVELYRILVESGRHIDITANHRLIDDNFNFIHGRDIELGTVLLMNGGYDKRKYEGSGEGSGWTTNYSGHVNPETGKVFKDLAYSEVERFKELRKGTFCDSCGKEYDGSRFEAHHNTIDPPNSDLKWLCNSCHKKADYELGNRIGIWSSGYKMVAEKVIKKYSIGVEDCYDIEMEDPTRPTFIANGFVSHNSHSVGYSLISWATAYFKTYYPQEFYRSLCNFNEDDKLKKLLREYIEQGHGRILPPKIGKSELGWTVEGNDLRGGLSDILPEGACHEILSLYPIKDAEDLKNRLSNRRKVNSRVWGIIEEHELFSDNDDLDPFNLYEFSERMSRIKDRTHKLGELGYNFGFRDVIVAGIMDRQVNEKSISELKQSQKLKDFSKTEEYGDAWCLTGETKIVIGIEQGNQYTERKKCTKSIKDISVGDTVLSMNMETNEKEFDKVIGVSKRFVDKICRIGFDNQNWTKSSFDHPFFVIGKGWIECEKVEIGDELIQLKYPGLKQRVVMKQNSIKMWTDCEKDVLGRTKRDFLIEQVIDSNESRDNVGMKEKCSEASNMLWSSEGFNKKMSDIHKNNWKDSDYASRISKSQARKPTKPERKLFDLLNREFLGEWEYVGDGRVCIGGHNPDFIGTNGKKKIIELNGCYWHGCKQCGFDNYYDGRRRDIRDDDKREDYELEGYETLFVWEHELQDEERLINIIKTYNFNPNIEIVKVVSKDVFHQNTIVYNFQTEKNNTFFANGILTHNCIIFLIDETGGPINVHFKNKIYPKFKDWIWQKKVNEDIIVIKGLIPPNMNYVIAKDAWDGEELKVSGGRCFKCPLLNAPMVPPSGPIDAEIMLLGMVPGRDEVKPENMHPFAGAAGVVLDAEIIKAGSHRKKFRVTNACLCRSATDEDQNRDPTDEELSCCNERLMLEIDEIQPKVIMPLGRVAYKALIGKDAPIGTVEGTRIDWGDYIVVPTFHPASCLYSDGDSKKLRIRQAIEYALKLAREIK